jgi:hypothetical protein
MMFSKLMLSLGLLAVTAVPALASVARRDTTSFSLYAYGNDKTIGGLQVYYADGK